jgi:hypothetical protein
MPHCQNSFKVPYQNKECHTVGTVPKSHIKTNNATLSEQFQSPIEKWKTTLFVLIWDFGTVLTVCHYLFLYWALELCRQCGIICFDMGFWNGSTVRTVPKSHIKTNTATLSEQFQSPIEKWKTNNATLTKKFQSPVEKQMMSLLGGINNTTRDQWSQIYGKVLCATYQIKCLACTKILNMLYKLIPLI